MAATFKVATLIVKTLVKPLANQLKKNAANEGWFREACGQMGQAHNLIMTHIQLRSMGHKVKKVKPLPTDEAVKSGADLFAEGMVLGTGLLAIAAEVLRKQRSDRAAALKAQLAEIEEKKRKELRLIEKERQLRDLLHGLEARIVEMENSKIQQLHEKLLHEQIKHISVTENLMKRIGYLESQLHIKNQFPLMVKDIKSLDTLRQRTNELYRIAPLSAEIAGDHSDIGTESANQLSLPSAGSSSPQGDQASHPHPRQQQQSPSQQSLPATNPHPATDGAPEGSIDHLSASTFPSAGTILSGTPTPSSSLTATNPLIRHDSHPHDMDGQCQLDETNIINSIICVDLPAEVLRPSTNAMHRHVIPVSPPPQQQQQQQQQQPSQQQQQQHSQQQQQQQTVTNQSDTHSHSPSPIPSQHSNTNAPSTPTTTTTSTTGDTTTSGSDSSPDLTRIEPLLDIIPHPDDPSDL